MKRLWIGIALLVAILAAGLWTSHRLEEIHTSITENLDRAAQSAQQAQWAQADGFAEKAISQWQEGWHFSAALADHTFLDEIDGLFAQAEVYRKNRDAVAYAALCARLSCAIDAIQESHSLNWWNLL